MTRWLPSQRGMMHRWVVLVDHVGGISFMGRTLPFSSCFSSSQMKWPDGLPRRPLVCWHSITQHALWLMEFIFTWMHQRVIQVEYEWLQSRGHLKNVLITFFRGIPVNDSQTSHDEIPFARKLRAREQVRVGLMRSVREMHERFYGFTISWFQMTHFL